MLFSILIFDEPDTAHLRDKVRQQHLDYLSTFDDDTFFAGPFTSNDETADLGSLRLIDLPDRAAAEQHLANEPYVIAGIQKRWLIDRWKPLTPYTWRDCPRTQGNIQALFYAIDKDRSSDIRQANDSSQAAYLAEHQAAILSYGALTSEDGLSTIGNIALLDVTDLATGRELIESSPYFKAGSYQHVTFHRWRFGRVFDRFKR